MSVGQFPNDAANFILPELSFIRIRRPIVENLLLNTIQTHAVTLGLFLVKTIANHFSNATLQSAADSPCSSQPRTLHLHVAKN